MCEVTADEESPPPSGERVSEPESVVVPSALPPKPHPYQVNDTVWVEYEGECAQAAITFRADSFTSLMLLLSRRMEPYADRMPILFDRVTGDYVDLLQNKLVRLRPI